MIRARVYHCRAGHVHTLPRGPRPHVCILICLHGLLSAVRAMLPRQFHSCTVTAQSKTCAKGAFATRRTCPRRQSTCARASPATTPTRRSPKPPPRPRWTAAWRVARPHSAGVRRNGGAAGSVRRGAAHRVPVSLLSVAPARVGGTPSAFSCADKSRCIHGVPFLLPQRARARKAMPATRTVTTAESS